MEITLAVLADAANLSQEGKLNLLGVFQTIHTPVVPFKLPSMTFVAMAQLEISDKGIPHSFKLVIHDEDMHEIWLSGEVPFSVAHEDQRLNPELPFMFRFQNFEFPIFGVYQFDIYIDDKKQRELSPLKVVVQPIIQPPPE